MRWINAGLTAAVLFSAPAFADDAQQTATTTMRAAMAEQANMPASPHAKAGDPSSQVKPKVDAQQTKVMKHAHQHATADANTRADSMHAAMANKAAMSAMSSSMMGGSSGSCQATSDCQNGSGMARSTSMSPGSGMMGGTTSGGPSGGGATFGATTGGDSMPMGGKRQ